MSRPKEHNQILAEAANNYTTLIDAASATVTYIGKAPFGTATTAAAWQIKKVSVSGTVTTIAWASGDDSFNQVWADRATLNYS